MLSYNLKRIFILRGISNPFSYLVDNGFSVTTASRLLHGKVNALNFKFVEKLCILFKCTPNDLLAWTPGKNTQLPNDLPLLELNRSTDLIAITQMRTNLPLNELEKKMNGLLEDLK